MGKHLLLESRLETLQQMFPQFDQSKIEEIVSADPTDNKKYIIWIAKQVAIDPNFIGALSKIDEDLAYWDKNINRLSYDDFIVFLIPAENSPHKECKKKECND